MNWKADLQAAVADYGIVRGWVAAHPLVSVGAALVVGILLGWL